MNRVFTVAACVIFLVLAGEVRVRAETYGIAGSWDEFSVVYKNARQFISDQGLAGRDYILYLRYCECQGGGKIFYMTHRGIQGQAGEHTGNLYMTFKRFVQNKCGGCKGQTFTKRIATGGGTKLIERDF